MYTARVLKSCSFWNLLLIQARGISLENVLNLWAQASCGIRSPVSNDTASASTAPTEVPAFPSGHKDTQWRDKVPKPIHWERRTLGSDEEEWVTTVPSWLRWMRCQRYDQLTFGVSKWWLQGFSSSSWTYSPRNKQGVAERNPQEGGHQHCWKEAAGAGGSWCLHTARADPQTPMNLHCSTLKVERSKTADQRARVLWQYPKLTYPGFALKAVFLFICRNKLGKPEFLAPVSFFPPTSFPWEVNSHRQNHFFYITISGQNKLHKKNRDTQN